MNIFKSRSYNCDKDPLNDLHAEIILIYMVLLICKKNEYSNIEFVSLDDIDMCMNNLSHGQVSFLKKLLKRIKAKAKITFKLHFFIIEVDYRNSIYSLKLRLINGSYKDRFNYVKKIYYQLTSIEPNKDDDNLIYVI